MRRKRREPPEAHPEAPSSPLARRSHRRLDTARLEASAEGPRSLAKLWRRRAAKATRADSSSRSSRVCPPRTVRSFVASLACARTRPAAASDSTRGRARATAQDGSPAIWRARVRSCTAVRPRLAVDCADRSGHEAHTRTPFDSTRRHSPTAGSPPRLLVRFSHSPRR